MSEDNSNFQEKELTTTATTAIIMTTVAYSVNVSIQYAWPAVILWAALYFHVMMV